MTLQNKPPVGGLPPEFPPQAGGPPHQPKFPDSPYLSDVGRRIRDDILDMLPLLRKHAAESEQLGALAPATLAAVDRSGAFKITIPVELEAMHWAHAILRKSSKRLARAMLPPVGW